MKTEIEVPDEVIEKIEHMMALGIIDEMPLEEYLVACVVADTRCILELHGCPLSKEWPDESVAHQPKSNASGGS